MRVVPQKGMAVSEELHEVVNEHAGAEPKLVVSTRVYRIPNNMTIELVRAIQGSHGFMKAIGPDDERIGQALEINRFDHEMAPDLIDREYLKPCHKWNDAPAWTPGGGAPRRRGRRRS